MGQSSIMQLFEGSLILAGLTVLGSALGFVLRPRRAAPATAADFTPTAR